jgi:hypothetical protein
VEQGEVKVSGAGGATTKKKKNYLKTKRRSKVSRPEAMPGESGSIELVVKANDAQVSRRDRLKSLRERQHSLFNVGGGAGAVKTNPMLKNNKEKL